MAIIGPVDQAARDRIRDQLDSTLFVEAGAGTGKTTALVARIIRLVASGRAELRCIATITFTEAAAAELRDRVRSELETAARDESGLPDDERERCRSALAQVDAAAIQTLHGFAQRILAEHPLEAGLPPLLEVQDELRASLAFQDRWSAWVDELLDDPEMEAVLVRALSLGMELDHLRVLARAFHEHWDRVEDWQPARAGPLSPVEAAELIEALQAASGLRGHCVSETDKLPEHLERLERYHDRLAAATSQSGLLRVLGERVPIKTGHGNQNNWPGVPLGPLRDELKSAEAVRSRLLDEARLAVLPHLLAALHRFTLGYAQERRRHGRLEFHDLLVLARDLLRHNGSVRQTLRRKFSHLLIDEFQDTDPLQIEIALLIAGEPAAPPPSSEGNSARAGSWEAPVDPEPGRLFFVGDPKQSIYRFRRADIALYQQVQSRFAEHAVRLTQNFRSLAPVIDFVNHVFRVTMGQGELEAQARYVPLDAAWPAPDQEPGATVLLLGEPQGGTADEIRAREAAEIAQVLQAAKGEGWLVADRDATGQRFARPARYADIALLLPTRTGLPALEQALDEADIPYRVMSRSLVYDTQEVRELLSILGAIDDPTDEVAVVAALRSPAFGCGDDDLLRYRRAGGRWDYRRAATGSLPVHDPVAEAMAALRGLHRRRWWEGVSGIVDAVMRERRLFELAFAQRRPRERWQRLRFVLDQARAFEEAGGGTLRQFVEWAERQAAEGATAVESVVPEEDDDAVSIMTVHASKGLEFPIVVLAGLNVAQAHSGQRWPARALWSAAGSPEVQFGREGSRFATLGFASQEEREQRMQQHEQVRLLYVACTRARDHLVLSLHHKNESKCHARTLHRLCEQAPHLWRRFAGWTNGSEPARDEQKLFDDSAEHRQEWLRARRADLSKLARASVTAATTLARQAGGGAADPGLLKDGPAVEDPPWRRGRAGTSAGRAVHAVLQTVDLSTGEGLEGVARAQALAEGIPHRAAEIERLARAALSAACVRQAVAGGRYWREVYVAAPVDGVTVEGFVDLVYESDDGLVVVDYKTDALAAEADLGAAVARYRLQGGAYALALEQALGRPVTRCVFVFLGPAGARERDIDGLSQAVADARNALATLG